VVLSIYSEFYQIGTPHFSLEGVVGWDFPAKKHARLSGQKVFLNVISSVLTAAKAYVRLY